MKDFVPSFLLSLAMGVIVYLGGDFLTDSLGVSPILLLIVSVVVGLLLYLGLAKILRIECLDYLIKTLKEFRNRKSSSKE